MNHPEKITSNEIASSEDTKGKGDTHVSIKKHYQDDSDSETTKKRLKESSSSYEEKLLDGVQKGLEKIKSHSTGDVKQTPFEVKIPSDKEETSEGLNKQLESDHLQEQSASTPNPLYHGSSRETLESLLHEIVKLNINDYKNPSALLEDIYNFYKGNNQKHEQSSFDEQFFEDIQCPDGVKRTTLQRAGKEEEYVYFVNEEEYARADKEKFSNYTRMVLNLKPDRAKTVTQEIITKIAKLPYVGGIKVAKNIGEADVPLDNVIIGFHDPSGSTHRGDLEQLLCPYKNDTRSSHASMLEPIDNEIQGIAFGDYAKGSSFGITRCIQISNAMWSLNMRNKEINFKTLLEKVTQNFKYASIKPEAPHMNE